MKQIFTTFAIITFAFFSCKKDKDKTPPAIPLVQTAALTNVNITAGTATAGGSIVSDGGAIVTQSGIVWSKINNTPTLTDSVIAGTTATGTFTNNITGLDFSNTYYFRAFATNSVGTGYGNVVTLTTSSDSVRFMYNGQSVTYGIIISSTTGKKWLDRNIGAKQVATAYDDYLAYGDIFQWGRPADGHQLINWNSATAGTPVNGMTTTLATSDNPGHNNYITTTDNPYDWRNDNNRNRWAIVLQGPCPAGWHVPTINEWKAEVSTSQQGGTATSGGITDRNTAYSQLKLTSTGRRREDGQFRQVGNTGYYWSSSDRMNFDSPPYSDVMYIETGSVYVDLTAILNKSGGGCVRCIKD